MPRWLFALVFATLVFYTDDYVIAGVLPEIARDLNVSVGAAGQLVTVFSMVVGLAAPVAALCLGRAHPRPVLATAAAIASGANVLAALTPSFTVLMVARVLAAVATAASTPSLFALAARLSPPDKLGRYIAVLALGVTGAMAVGVPVGTWVSTIGTWRGTFALMAVLAASVSVCLLATLPRSLTSTQLLSLMAQVRVLAAPQISLAIIASSVLILGSVIVLTYLSPFVSETALTDISARGALFAVSGVAGIVGIWVGGRTTDKIGPDATLTIGVCVFIGTMLALFACWVSRPVSVVLLYPLMGLWGAAAFWYSPAVTARLAVLAGPNSTQALALNTSGNYLGAAAAGAIGGLVINTAGSGLLTIVGACFGLLALVLFRIACRYAPSEAVVEEAA
jgi:DHA1 family purine base/nucleoside efflux pump-like MFS transporter